MRDSPPPPGPHARVRVPKPAKQQPVERTLSPRPAAAARRGGSGSRGCPSATSIASARGLEGDHLRGRGLTIEERRAGAVEPGRRREEELMRRPAAELGRIAPASGRAARRHRAAERLGRRRRGRRAAAGRPGGIRTHARRIKSPLLWPLSYGPTEQCFRFGSGAKPSMRPPGSRIVIEICGRTAAASSRPQCRASVSRGASTSLLDQADETAEHNDGATAGRGRSAR